MGLHLSESLVIKGITSARSLYSVVYPLQMVAVVQLEQDPAAALKKCSPLPVLVEDKLVAAAAGDAYTAILTGTCILRAALCGPRCQLTRKW